MNILAMTKLYVFEGASEEHHVSGKVRWWQNVQEGKQVPFAFARTLLLTSDLSLLSVAIAIGIMTHASIMTIVGIELLYLCIFALLFTARALKQVWPVIGCYLVVIVLTSMLNLLFPGAWGLVEMYVLCVTVLYRFPLNWSLPLAGLCVLALIVTDGAMPLAFVQHTGNAGLLAFNLALAAILCWFGWTRRSQYLLVMRLHEVQEQLREQMARSEELATERERTRIARDIHDVLSHSLAVLSIQVQAARQLVTRDPERLASKLDDMAALIRESITESRRVVGLLRETPQSVAGSDDLSANLRSIAATFNERTGIHCRFEESGVPHKLNAQQRETLQLALREMLTNAHRHGAAQTVWITVRWREASILLEVHDDGRGVNATHRDLLMTEMANSANSTGGHHGLQGMRERAAALGGEVTSGPIDTGGFTVTLRLPFEASSVISAQKVAYRE